MDRPELNRLLSLPTDKLDLGDGRELLLQYWSPSVSSGEAQEVKVRIEGVIVFKNGEP